MAVAGIEIAVGQVWKCRDGQLYRVAEHDAGDADYPWRTKSVSASGPGFWLTDTGLDREGHKSKGDLIQLVTDEHGFTIWRGGEQPAETKGLRVEGRFRDGYPFGPEPADTLSWVDTGECWDIVAYKLVAADKKLEWPTLPDSAPEVQFELPGVAANPLDVQVGGDHYKKRAIQPIEYIHANKLGFAEGNVVKYVTRWRDKNGIKDLEKARHYIDLLIQLEQREGGV